MGRAQCGGKHRHGLHKRNTPEVGSVTLLYASLVEPQWAASARIDPRPPRGEGDDGPAVSEKQDTARSSVLKILDFPLRGVKGGALALGRP